MAAETARARRAGRGSGRIGIAAYKSVAVPRFASFVNVVASLERHEAAWEAEGDALRPEQGQKTRFGNMHPPRRHIDRRCRRLIRSLHAPLAQEERMTSLGQMSGYDSSSRTRDTSNIRQYGIVANWAGVSNPPDCADPGLHPDRRRDQVAKRPNTGATAVRASVEGSHLLSGFAQPSETMPKRARRILATPRVSRTHSCPLQGVVESAES